MVQLQTDPLATAVPDPRHGLRGPITSLALAALAGTILAAVVAGVLVGWRVAPLGLVVSAHAVGTLLAISLMRRGYPHERLGLCNLVTLSRMALAAALLAPLAAPASSWVVPAVAAFAFALDGADGWLARRDGHVSEFGARFDMEVDSALALILALNAWAAGAAGAVVLLIGLPRYLFAAAGIVLPWLNRPTPERFSRKAVCVLQIGTLIALQLPWVTATMGNPIILVVAAALSWSFGRDVMWLWQTRS